MPQPREVDAAVLHLGTKDAWRLNECPDGIANERMLRELGVKGYLDARMWTWFNPNPTMYRVENPKPLQEQPWGLWRPLLKIRDWKRLMGLGDDRHYPPGEIRLNDLGMSRFACLQEGETAVPADSEATKRKPGRPRKSKRGKATVLTQRQTAVVEIHEAHNQSFVEIARLWKKSAQSVEQLYKRALKNPGYKKRRSVNVHDAKQIHANTRRKPARADDE